jgi:hypothetical protein
MHDLGLLRTHHQGLPINCGILVDKKERKKERKLRVVKEKTQRNAHQKKPPPPPTPPPTTTTPQEEEELPQIQRPRQRHHLLSPSLTIHSAAVPENQRQ